LLPKLVVRLRIVGELVSMFNGAKLAVTPLSFPALSVNLVAPMLIDEAPSRFVFGVKVAEYTVALVVVNVPKVPLFIVTSVKSNPTTGSENVKVMVAVSPAFKEVVLEVMVTVGLELF
jgi:hypothetical protein